MLRNTARPVADYYGWDRATDEELGRIDPKRANLASKLIRGGVGRGLDDSGVGVAQRVSPLNNPWVIGIGTGLVTYAIISMFK